MSGKSGDLGGRRLIKKKHADGGRFACAVRPEESKDLALMHLKADAIHGHEVAEPLFQVFHLDGQGMRVVVHDKCQRNRGSTRISADEYEED